MQQYYVYGLFDPITDQIFYVGKGKNGRDKSHLKPSLWKSPKDTKNSFLYYKIRSLMENNTPPIIKRIEENLSENSAYEIEAELIRKYGRRFSEERGILFNIADHKGSSRGSLKPWTEERRKKHRSTCREKRLYDPSYEELYDEYVTQGLTRPQIAEKHNVSEALVKKRLQYFGIMKPKDVRYPSRNKFICEKCGIVFYTPHSIKNRHYCSNACRRKLKNVS